MSDLLADSARLKWYCEPARWQMDADTPVLRVWTDADTDYWRKTHYGFVADNGHFLYAEAPGDWTLTAHVRFNPANQYDQAGLMVRVSPECWIKTSVEYETDMPWQLGAVVTNDGYSDWSTQAFPADRNEAWFRIIRAGADYTVQWSADGKTWEQLRVTHLHADEASAPVSCGVYACSPKGAGFMAEFTAVTLE